MLKSELLISDELNSLNSYLEDYSTGFLTLTFSDERRPSREGYKNERIRLLKLVKDNPEELRSIFIPHILKEKEIFFSINSILKNNNNLKDWNIDALLFRNVNKQMDTVEKIIDDCCINATVNYEMINRYFLNSLQLLVYFTAIRSSIATIRNIYKKFNHNDDGCVLKFVHTNRIPFSIIQQKMIVDFIEKVLSSLFANHLDIITVEFDTGSPSLGCSVNTNNSKISLDIKLNINKLFSDLFTLIKEGRTDEAIKKAKQINDQINKNEKMEIKILNSNSIKQILSPDEYKERLLSIIDKYNEMRDNNILLLIKEINKEPDFAIIEKVNKIEKELSLLENKQIAHTHIGVVDERPPLPKKKPPKKPEPPISIM